jgi:hypothetical protein
LFNKKSTVDCSATKFIGFLKEDEDGS